MKYFVVIETYKIIEVDAPNEEMAITQIKNQLDAQDPRNTAKLSIAKEVIL